LGDCAPPPPPRGTATGRRTLNTNLLSNQAQCRILTNCIVNPTIIPPLLQYAHGKFRNPFPIAVLRMMKTAPYHDVPSHICNKYINVTNYSVITVTQLQCLLCYVCQTFSVLQRIYLFLVDRVLTVQLNLWFVCVCCDCVTLVVFWLATCLCE